MAESTATTFNLSHELVKSWSPCADGYRWFLGKFPQGGAYTAVHAALRADKRFDDTGWLFRAALSHALRNAPATTDDIVAAQSDEAAKLIEGTSHVKLIKVPNADEVKVTTEKDNGDDYAQIGSSGDYAQIGSSGYGARIGSSGYGAQIGSSGYDAQIGSSGYGAQIGSSGYGAQIGSSGDYARIGSSGDYAQIGSSGDYARIGSSGDYARIGSSGGGARINATGEKATIASSGIGARAKAGKDGAMALAYWDEKSGRPRFAVGYVGENIKPDVWYSLDADGNFIESAD